jgi:hypothetical protein
MNMKNDQQQERVWNLANGIMSILAGVPIAEAQTAISIAIAATIIASEPEEDWSQAISGMSAAVRAKVFDQQMIDWVRSVTYPVSESGRA